MQGLLPDASGFLVSGLPSRLFFSEAVLDTDGEATALPPGREAIVLPPKTQKALDLFMQTFSGGAALAGSVRLYSNTPPGKGLSSSSTDILSVLFVVNDYLQAGCAPEDLYRIAAAIEPTDPCLSDDIVVFRQHAGIVDSYITLPPMTVLYFDAEPGRQIETLDVQRTWTPGTGKFYDWLLGRFLRAAKEGDYDTLFDSITYSAEYNQTIVSLARWDDYLQLARATQSGLMVAHSGTIVGFLTRPQQAAELQARLATATGQPIYSEQYSSSLF
jgi:L-threonine kinase